MLSKEEVGRNIKLARQIKAQKLGIKKYTQGMLAKDTGLSQSYIGDIETGRSYPSSTATTLISEATGVSTDFILGKEKKDIEANKPDTLEKIKESFSQFLDIVYLPVLGKIAAGSPILAEENIETYLPYSNEYDPQRHFVLRVQGDSMMEAGIVDGDLVVIHQQPTAEEGQIVAVRIEDDGVTLKRLKHINGQPVLIPCNCKYSPIIINKNASIIGVAVSVTKKLK